LFFGLFTLLTYHRSLITLLIAYCFLLFAHCLLPIHIPPQTYFYLKKYKSGDAVI
jgi:hypothetical protein